MIDYRVTNNGVAVLTWDLPGRPVNVMNDDSLALFLELIERAFSDDAVKGLVIASAKRDFITGADLVSFLSDRRPEVLYQKTALTQRILRRLESGGKPVCAALNGTALGGGFEIALACHHRVITNESKVRVGLPEVTLGLLPGAGGTQRLPRLIGVRNAIPLLVHGKTIPIDEAKALGMVDTIVEADRVLPSAIEWVEAQTAPVAQPWDVRGFKVPDGPIGPIDAYQVFALETARISSSSFDTRPAPKHILASVYEGHSVDIDTGLTCELRHFVSCACSEESQNIIRTTFFGTNNAAKLKQRPSDVPPLEINTLAVSGSGKEVQQWIEAALNSKLSVLWFNPDKTAIPEAWEKQVKCVDTAEALANADACLMAPGRTTVPAVPNFIIWTEGTEAPQSGQVCVNLPESKGRLVEIIHDGCASSISVAQAMDLSRTLRKVPVVVKTQGDSYIGRLKQAYKLYLEKLREEGVPSSVINNAARLSGMAEPPLPTSTQPTRSLPKEWEAARNKAVLLSDALLMVQADAAVECIEDGLVEQPLDADIAAVLGLGFPDAMGGPLGYIDTVGVEEYLQRRNVSSELPPISDKVRKYLESMLASSKRFHKD